MGLTNEGEEWALKALLRGEPNTADLFAGFYTNASEPAETATLSSGLTEVSGGSYARRTVERSSTGWPTLALDSNDFRAVSKILEFPAPTANWGTLTGAFLTTVSTGTVGILIATYHFSASFVVNSGDPAPTLRLYQKAA